MTSAHSSGGYSKSKLRRVGRSSSADVGGNRETSSVAGNGVVTEPWSQCVLVPISGGLFAKIDQADADVVLSYSWHLRKTSGDHVYAQTSIRRGKSVKRLRMHHLIVPRMPGTVTDHINGDTLDNRRANLRRCSVAQNCQNQALGKRNTSGYRGVSWQADKRRWRAYISVNGRKRFLGRYTQAEDAARAFDKAAREIWGEFATLNFPGPGEQPARRTTK